MPINNWVDSNYSILNTARISVLLLQYGYNMKIKASYILILLSREMHIHVVLMIYFRTLFMGANTKTG